MFKYSLNHFSPTGTFPLATCLAFPSFLTSTDFSAAHISIWHCDERYGPILPWALYVLLLPFAALLVWTWSILKFFKFLALALASKFCNSPRTTLTDFYGHLPIVFPNSAACPVLPVPLKCLVKGTHLLWARTSLRYCLAWGILIPLIALAV